MKWCILSLSFILLFILNGSNWLVFLLYSYMMTTKLQNMISHTLKGWCILEPFFFAPMNIFKAPIVFYLRNILNFIATNCWSNESIQYYQPILINNWNFTGAILAVSSIESLNNLSIDLVHFTVDCDVFCHSTKS